LRDALVAFVGGSLSGPLNVLTLAGRHNRLRPCRPACAGLPAVRRPGRYPGALRLLRELPRRALRPVVAGNRLAAPARVGCRAALRRSCCQPLRPLRDSSRWASTRGRNPSFQPLRRLPG